MSSGKIVLISAIVVLLLAGGYYLYSQNISKTTPADIVYQPTVSATPKALPESTAAAVSKTELVISLIAQNNSTESGTATLKEVNGKTMVTLALTGGPKTTPQPAHIHLGSCPNPDAIKYPLTNVLNGKSETTIDTTISELLKMLPLAVNIHKSAAKSKVYVACGNIAP